MKYTSKLPRLGRVMMAITLALVALFVVVALVTALELPPTGSVAFIQTSGPNTALNIGDWYSRIDQGNRPHQFAILVPCTVAPGQVFTVDLFDPELLAGTVSIDEIRNTPDNATFELRAPNNSVIATRTYTPSAATNDVWSTFTTFDVATYGCGTYNLFVRTSDDDDNAWRLRLTPDDSDGVPGTGDELSLGTFESSFQHSAPGCQTFYFFVPVTTSIRLNNFDMDFGPFDPTASIIYTQPGGTTVAGTVSAGTVWNNGNASTRGGDVFTNPPSGWWQAQVCVQDDNQYIFEPEGLVYYFEPPPIPVVTVAKDDGRTIVGPNDVLTYTITFSNTSPPSTGAALNVVLTDTIPTNTTYVNGSCAVNPPFSGTCNENSGQVTFIINEAVITGAVGSVRLAVRVNPDASGTVSNSVTLNYEDGFGHKLPPETADDVDLIPLFDLQLSKTDNGIITVPGGVVTYTLTYSNVGVGNATGVVITETVPANTTFNAAASAPTTWTCVPGGGVAGDTCTTNIGPVAGGTGGSVTFAVTVDNPLPPGVIQIANAAVIGDDGSQGPDPTPGDNNATDTTPVSVPDLQLNKTDGGVAAGPGGTIVYTLTYTNISPANATGVVITETVPANTTFNAGASAPTTWTCLPGGGIAGDTCTTNIGPVAGGTGGSVTFAVTVDDPLPPGVNQIANTARIGDDGSQGPDPTPGDNISDDTTPIIIIVDPRITKAASLSLAQPGDPVIFSIIAFNPSPPSTASATNVTVTDTLPLQIDLVTYTVASTPPGLVGGTTVTTNTISTAGHPSGVTQTVASTITVDIPTLGLGQVVTLVVTSTVNNLASPPPVVIENLAVLGFAQGAPRSSNIPSVNVPAPAPPANPTGGRGGGDDDDDDDDDDNPPPSAASQPAAAAVQPTPALPVLFLPETGLAAISRTTSTTKGIWLLPSTLGVITAAFLLWRRNRKLK